jgi:hypothetical protein
MQVRIAAPCSLRSAPTGCAATLADAAAASASRGPVEQSPTQEQCYDACSALATSEPSCLDRRVATGKLVGSKRWQGCPVLACLSFWLRAHVTVRTSDYQKKAQRALGSKAGPVEWRFRWRSGSRLLERKRQPAAPLPDRRVEAKNSSAHLEERWRAAPPRQRAWKAWPRSPAREHLASRHAGRPVSSRHRDAGAVLSSRSGQRHGDHC